MTLDVVGLTFFVKKKNKISQTKIVDGQKNPNQVGHRYLIVADYAILAVTCL